MLLIVGAYVNLIVSCVRGVGASLISRDYCFHKFS